MRYKTFLSIIQSDNIHPIVLTIQNIHNLIKKNNDNSMIFNTKNFYTCPRLTSNSSSTQGVKSCRTTILLSGDNPCSFSIPTRTRVSILADPVILPIPGASPDPGRDKSFSPSGPNAEKFNQTSNKTIDYETID